VDSRVTQAEGVGKTNAGLLGAEGLRQLEAALHACIDALT
jgi:hypothetical protein